MRTKSVKRTARTGRKSAGLAVVVCVLLALAFAGESRGVGGGAGFEGKSERDVSWAQRGSQVTTLSQTSTSTEQIRTEIATRSDNGSEGPTAQPPRFEDMLKPSAPIHDMRVKRLALRSLLETPPTPYTTADGMTVYFSTSDYYLHVPAIEQAWVDFLDRLVHGPELDGLRVHMDSPDEITAICGAGAAACFDPSTGDMYIAGEDNGGIPLEQAVAHEYGHRIASNRSDAPWSASDWGTKRWASYTRVCPHVLFTHDMYPGDEGAHYTRNPGEGFAEAYRHLNELQAQNWQPIGWIVVDPIFQPTPEAFSLLRRDITDPWSGPTAYRKTGRLAPHGVRRYHVPAWDGRVTAQVTAPHGASVSFSSGFGGRFAGPARRISGLTCGDKVLTVTVTSRRGGRFALNFTAPTG